MSSAAFMATIRSDDVVVDNRGFVDDEGGSAMIPFNQMDEEKSAGEEEAKKTEAAVAESRNRKTEVQSTGGDGDIGGSTDKLVTKKKLRKASSKKNRLSRKLSESWRGQKEEKKMFRKNEQDFWPLPLDETQPIVDYHKSSHVDDDVINNDASANHRSIYVGIHTMVDQPKARKHHHHHHHRSHHHHRGTSGSIRRRANPKKIKYGSVTTADASSTKKEDTMSPSRRVEFILGRNDMSESNELISSGHPETPKLFTELEELQVNETNSNESFWKETARWVKFEETVEDGGDRWSKPHVATLSLQSLFDLRRFLATSSVQLNCHVDNFSSLIDRVLELFVADGHLPDDEVIKKRVRTALLSNHEHQGEKRRKSVNEMSKKSSSFFEKKTFMRKIPLGAEASNILIGEQGDLKKPIIAFIRLKEAMTFDRLTEVPIPTRFVFILLGPRGRKQQYHEVGRSIATLMADEIFHEVAYKAKTRADLLTGIDEFLQQVTVLPPGEWDKTIRIEPPQTLPADQKKRLKEEPFNFNPATEKMPHSSPGPELRRTGRLFGGLIEDIRRKSPFYLSDFKDALNVQCVASFIFLYFAVLTPIVTFGGLLDDATHSYLGTMESLLGGCMAGVAFHLFSGQPLTIIGSTGPILVFEKIMNELCGSLDINYISFRFWVGTWTGLACILLVAFDASSAITYVTRYTEESFSALISLIFIFEAFKKLFSEAKKHKIWPGWQSERATLYGCQCGPPDLFNVTIRDSFTDAEMINMTELSRNKTNTKLGEVFNFGNDSFACVFKDNVIRDLNVDTWSDNHTKSECIGNYCGQLVGESCDYAPDIFFMSVLLFFGTYTISVMLKSIKTSRYFTNKVRSLISDFAVTIAIVIMVIVDLLLGFETSKLQVPATFKPTRDDRGWFISPLGGNQWWTIPMAIIPAMLATILIFMDQQITAVIVNRKENKLKKSCGYHLDLLVVAIMLIICSVMGLPWFVAATVLSITHVNSLRMESESAAPGEKPKFLGVREQRVTGILIFLMIGVSVFLTPVLAKIPMPILYGVFLYMGTSSLNGVQLFDRMMLFLMPSKHQPDYSYLRHVPLRKVHLFTLLQFGGLVVLWVVKSVKPVSIVFPMMVAALVGIRKLFDYGLFSQHDLMWLDDVMPEFSRGKKKKRKKLVDSDADDLDDDVKEQPDLTSDVKKYSSSVCLKIDDDDDETAM